MKSVNIIELASILLANTLYQVCDLKLIKIYYYYDGHLEKSKTKVKSKRRLLHQPWGA